MPKKFIHDRLEKLFEELDQDLPAIPVTGERPFLGWVWECDGTGRFTACSPEVEAVLGIPAEDFIGQPLSVFRLHDPLVGSLNLSLRSGKYPSEVFLYYLSKRGGMVPVALTILGTAPDDEETMGWRGFTQVVEIPEEAIEPLQIHEAVQSPTNGKAPAEEFLAGGRLVEKEKRVTQKAAGEKIMEILENIRQSFPEVNNFPFSRITLDEKFELREDRSQKPSTIGSMAGRHIYIYPKILAKGVEYKLEWGEKLDFTEDEKKYLLTNKSSQAGVLGNLQRRMAPQKILRCDMQWISIIFMDESEETRWLRVSYPKAQAGQATFGLDEFLKNPKLIYAELIIAINNPWKTRQVYKAGVDYLVSK